MRRRWRILLKVLALWLVYILATGGGLVVWTRKDFGGQRDIALAPGLAADVWIEPTMSKIGAPLFLILERWTPPYSLRIQVWDHEASFRAVEVTEFLVEYADGTVIHRTEPWARELVPYSRTAPHSLKLVARVPGLVTQHRPLHLTLVGRLTRPDGSAQEFRTRNDFTPESGWKVDSLLVSLGGV